MNIVYTFLIDEGLRRIVFSRITAARLLVLLTAFLIFMSTALSAERASSGASRKAEARRQRIDVKGFVFSQRVIRGKGWTLRKVQDEKRLWKAQLEVEDGTIRDFGNGAESDSWVRFLLWPIPEPGTVGIPNPHLIFVLCYGGGANGPEFLNVVDTRDGFSEVFNSGDKFNFNGVEDLDGDGIPEIIGMSRAFLGVMGLAVAESPMPTVVFRYDNVLKRYVCSNKSFRRVLDEAIPSFERAYDAVKPVSGKIDLKTDDAKTFSGQFGPLIRLVVELFYAGDGEKAKSLLSRDLGKNDARTVLEAIEKVLSEDPFYQELISSGR